MNSLVELIQNRTCPNTCCTELKPKISRTSGVSSYMSDKRCPLQSRGVAFSEILSEFNDRMEALPTDIIDVRRKNPLVLVCGAPGSGNNINF